MSAHEPNPAVTAAEAGVAARMVRACNELKSTGNTIFGKV